MPVQAQARAQLARLRGRLQPANGDSPTAGATGSLTAELAPGQLTRAAEIKLVKSWPLDRVRELARGQIQRTKDAFEKASDVPWYTDPYLRVINRIRWGPSLKMIEDAEESYAHALTLSSEAEKKESFVSAWTIARLALTAIAKEAKFGETGYIYLAEDLGRAAVDAAAPYVKQVGQGLELGLWVVLGAVLVAAVSK